ncbi:MAG: hypothetical protein ACE5LU_02050 [Anaerolineae bacterium]
MMKKRLRTVVSVMFVMLVLGSVRAPFDVSAFHPRERIKLYAGPNKTGDLLWTIERIPFFYQPAWWVFEGPPNYYPPVYTYTEEHFFEGSGLYGEILFTFDNDTAYAGPNILWPPLFHFEGNRLYEGRSSRGRILYYFFGERVFEGANATGEIVLNATDDILSFPGPLPLVIGVLLGGQIPEPTPEPPPPPAPPPPPPPF